MTPVISPWVFYAISVADGIAIVAAIATFIVGIAYLIFKGISLVNFWEYGKQDESYQRANSIAKHLGKIALVAIILSSIVPSEKTITKMIVAQNVTYERLEAATDVVQTVYEDIMELFAEKESE